MPQLSKKNAVRGFAIGAFILISGLCYWNVRVYQKTGVLRDVSRPFASACQQAPGCTTSPAGWNSDNHGGYWNAGMRYTANHESFVITWKIGTGVSLVATGGWNRDLTIQREID